MLDVLIRMVTTLAEQTSALDREIVRLAKEEGMPSRSVTILGVGPITAILIAALVPPVDTSCKGRDFATWLGLPPVQRSTGGRQKFGATSKMGERTIRRLLIIGAATLVRQTSRREPPPGSRLAHTSPKATYAVITALANKMARTVWPLLGHNEVYWVPAVAAT